MSNLPECPFDYLSDCENIDEMDESGDFTFLGFNCTLIERAFECDSMTSIVNGNSLSYNPPNTVLEEDISPLDTFSRSDEMIFEIPRAVTCDGEKCADYELGFPCYATLIGDAYEASNTLVHLGGMCAN